MGSLGPFQLSSSAPQTSQRFSPLSREEIQTVRRSYTEQQTSHEIVLVVLMVFQPGYLGA